MPENLPMAQEDFQQAVQAEAAQPPPETDANASAALAQLFETLQLPEELVRFSKILPDGAQTHLVMSTLALEELGGRANVQRVFENSVHDQRFTALFTAADLRYAASEDYRDIHSGETALQAQLRYIEENFGPVLEQMSEAYYETPLEERLKGWESNFDQYPNAHAVGDDNRAFGVVLLNLDEFFREFNGLDGSRQQKIDFLLGHELDHGDNYDADSHPMGLLSEVLSDDTGVNAVRNGHWLEFWNDRISREDFRESLIAERMEHELTRIIVFKVAGIWPSKERWDHNTGPFLPDSGNTVPTDADKGLAELEDRVEARISDRLPALLQRNYTVPSDAETLIFKSRVFGALFVDNHFNEVLARIDMPEDVRKDFEERASEVDDEINNDNLIAARNLLNDVRETFPDQAMAAIETVFYVNGMEDVEDLFSDPVLPPPLREYLQTRLDEIYELDGEEFEQAYSEFVRQFLEHNPQVFQRHIFEQAPELAIVTAFDIDPDAWALTLGQLAAEITAQKPLEDPYVRRAMDTFLEHRGLNPQPPVPENPVPGLGIEGQGT